MIRRTMLRSAALTFAATFAMGGVLSPAAYAQATHQTQHVTETFDAVVASCSGEDVQLSGTIEDVFQTTIDPNGGVHIVMQFTPQLTAIGLSSGTTYQAVGPAHITIYDVAAPSVTTGRNIIRLIGSGPGDNLLATETIRFIVNANGVLEVEVADTFESVCRG
jgi:hypothetical protein